MKNRRFYPDLHKQIKEIFPSDHILDKKANKIRILVKKVQHQNKNFCGFYSAAFATAICNHIDPELLEFDEKSLPNHFLQCLNNKRITMFPHTKKKNYNTARTIYEINL